MESHLRGLSLFPAIYFSKTTYMGWWWCSKLIFNLFNRLLLGEKRGVISIFFGMFVEDHCKPISLNIHNSYLLHTQLAYRLQHDRYKRTGSNKGWKKGQEGCRRGGEKRQMTLIQLNIWSSAEGEGAAGLM